jgi:hypothetical protein
MVRDCGPEIIIAWKSGQGEFLCNEPSGSIKATISFSRRTLLRGVNLKLQLRRYKVNSMLHFFVYSV